MMKLLPISVVVVFSLGFALQANASDGGDPYEDGHFYYSGSVSTSRDFAPVDLVDALPAVSVYEAPFNLESSATSSKSIVESILDRKPELAEYFDSLKSQTVMVKGKVYAKTLDGGLVDPETGADVSLVDYKDLAQSTQAKADRVAASQRSSQSSLCACRRCGAVYCTWRQNSVTGDWYDCTGAYVGPGTPTAQP